MGSNENTVDHLIVDGDTPSHICPNPLKVQHPYCEGWLWQTVILNVGWSVVTNVPIEADADNRGGYACVGEGRFTRNFLYFPLNVSVDPNVFLKALKKQGSSWRSNVMSKYSPGVSDFALSLHKGLGFLKIQKKKEQRYLNERNYFGKL